MRSLLALLTGTPRASLTIELDSDYVFLHGYGKEARGQYLRGTVSLTLAQGESVKPVQLSIMKTVSDGHHDDTEKKRIKIHTWEPFRVRGQPTQASMHRDVYEWPFELYIPGNWDETFKGCRHCGVAYRLEASTSFQDSKTDVFTFAPIRVIRCPTVSSYELLDPVMTHGKWGAKAEYNISLRHQAIAVGGLIPVDVELGMLEPGVELKKAKFYLTETHIVHDESKTGAASFLGGRLVEEWNMETVEPDQQVHSWEQCLSLPRIVSRCSPDFSIRGMTISHTFHFRATLLEDGIDTEYDASIPVTLVVSPELPITGWDIFARVDEKICTEVMDALAEGIQIPPEYCVGDYCTKDFDCYPDTPPPAFDRIVSNCCV